MNDTDARAREMAEKIVVAISDALAVIIAATVNVAAHINRPAASSALAAVWR